MYQITCCARGVVILVFLTKAGLVGPERLSFQFARFAILALLLVSCVRFHVAIYNHHSNHMLRPRSTLLMKDGTASQHAVQILVCAERTMEIPVPRQERI